VREIVIKPPRIVIQKRFFNLDDDEVNDEQK